MVAASWGECRRPPQLAVRVREFGAMRPRACRARTTGRALCGGPVSAVTTGSLPPAPAESASIIRTCDREASAERQSLRFNCQRRSASGSRPGGAVGQPGVEAVPGQGTGDAKSPLTFSGSRPPGIAPGVRLDHQWACGHSQAATSFEGCGRGMSSGGTMSSAGTGCCPWRGSQGRARSARYGARRRPSKAGHRLRRCRGGALRRPRGPRLPPCPRMVPRPGADPPRLAQLE